MAPRRACTMCWAEFPTLGSFLLAREKGKPPKCSGCRHAAHQWQRGRQLAAAGSAPPHGAAGAPQPHMTPCVCHCAACRAAGHGNGACVVLCGGLHALFDGKADVVELVLHHHGASEWDTAHLDAAVLCVQYGPGGDVIAAGDLDGRIHLICAHTGEKILSPPAGHARDVNALAWSPDGTKLASGSDDKTILIWNPVTGEELCKLTGHMGRVTGLCFDRSSQILASCSWDETLRLWDSATGVATGFPRSVNGRVSGIDFAPCGSTLAVTCNRYPKHSVRIFSKEVSTGEFVRQSTRQSHGSYVNGVACHPTKSLVASCSSDKKIKLWNMHSGEELWTVNIGGTVRSVTFSADGSRIAAACNDYLDDSYYVKILNSETGALLCALTGHTDHICSVVFSPDGTQLASGSDDTTVRVWRPPTGASPLTPS
jgi:WD40 repeat protein